jgi:hypothetical protein
MQFVLPTINPLFILDVVGGGGGGGGACDVHV